MAFVFPDLNEEEDFVVHISLDDGSEGDYMAIAMFECREHAIAAFAPADTDDDSDETEVILMEMEDYVYNIEDGSIEFQLENIEDPDLMDEVVEMFQELVEDIE